MRSGRYHGLGHDIHTSLTLTPLFAGPDGRRQMHSAGRASSSFALLILILLALPPHAMVILLLPPLPPPLLPLILLLCILLLQLRLQSRRARVLWIRSRGWRRAE